MATKKIITQTLKEFQAWLEGVEELQPKGWTPDKQQWAKIRKRIANIKELPVAADESNPARMQPGQVPMPVHQPVQPQPVPMQTSIPYTIPEFDMSPAAKQLLSTGKTPDVDASGGDVNSLFE